MEHELLRDYLQTMKTEYDSDRTISELRIIADDNVCFELKPGCDIRKLSTDALVTIMEHTIPVDKYVKTREQLTGSVVDGNFVSTLVVFVDRIRTPMTANELIVSANNLGSRFMSAKATVVIDGSADHYSVYDVYGCDTPGDAMVVICACKDGDLNCGG